jgi:hypothetical protein
MTTNKRYKIKSGIEVFTVAPKNIEASEVSQYIFSRFEKLTTSNKLQAQLIGQSFFYSKVIEDWQIKLLSFLEELCL